MGNRIKQSQIYAEVYSVLSVLGEEYICKIPQNVFNTISDKRNKQYDKEIYENGFLDETSLSPEAIAMLAALKLDYWCKTEQEKQELQNLLRINDEKSSGVPLSTNSKKVWINLLKNKK